MNKIFLYIGTYTLNTKSKGIYLFHFDLDSGTLSDCIDSISTSNPLTPSWKFALIDRIAEAIDFIKTIFKE